MAEGRKVEAIINGEYHLPEAIIQRIQSFMSAKQAAQTTILSKLWYAAWLTRPNLDFDERDFQNHRWCSDAITIGGVLELANKTMQSYKENKLNIESFSLYLEHNPHAGSYLVNKLISKALKRGATRLSFGLKYNHRKFVLGHEVLGSENQLVRLSLEGCKIDQIDQVRCSRLKSLILSQVWIQSDMIFNIISSCPLIENLSMSGIDLIEKQGVDNLVGLSVEGGKIDKCVDGTVKCLGLKSLSLSAVTIESESIFADNIESNIISNMILSCPLIEKLSFSRMNGFHGPINLHELLELRCLTLDGMEIDNVFFNDMSTKLSSLKDLTLSRCILQEGIQISSHSLECLHFEQEESLMVNFDVPSIRKFTFNCSIIPSVSFASTSMEWESHVSITCPFGLSTSWFCGLNGFLRELRQSKIYLSLNIHSAEKSFNYDVRLLQGLPKSQIENLIVDIGNIPYLSCYALFDGLFRICRPKLITQNLLAGEINNDFLCMALEQGLNAKCLLPSHLMYEMHDLEEVNVQHSDEVVAVWKPVSWNSLLDAFGSPRNEETICFQLKWRQ